MAENAGVALDRADAWLAAWRRSPFLVPLLVLWLVREVSVGVVCFIDAGAFFPALKVFLAQSLLYAGEGLVLLGLGETWRRIPPLRWIWLPVSVFMLFGVLLLSLIDPILYNIIGDRLSPSVLRQFVGWHLFVDSDFWQPVIANWLPVRVGVATLAAILFWVARELLHRSRRHPPPALHHSLLAVAAGVLSIGGVEQGSTVPLLEPTEIVFLREWTGKDALAYSAQERSQHIAALRAHLGLPRGARWQGERYPLIYEFVQPGPAPADPPDVFVFVVESLRGENCAPTNPSGAHLADTPHLSALAARAVVFPRYLSNGFPSGPGYIAVTCSAWPHMRKRIVDEFTRTPLDSLVQRMNTLGYHSLHAEAEPRFDKVQNWLQPYPTVLTAYPNNDIGKDVQLADATLDWLRRWDAAQARTTRPQPLFGLYLTKDPHLPYRYPEGQDQHMTFGPNLADNYVRSLHYVDAQLGRLFAYLAQRPRRRDTVILVTGDHANFLDQQQTRSLPVNDTVWSAALVAGPERLVGPARVERGIASQVDLVPTINALVGDRRPSAALGRDLLHDDGRPKGRAVAIRSGGLRYETDRGGMFVDAVLPRGGIPSGGFPTPATGTRGLDLEADELHGLVSIWTYLLERGEVWNPALLGAAPSH